MNIGSRVRDPQARYPAMRRTTLVGAFTNLGLAALQLAGGVVSQSQALVADGLHTLSDLIGDTVVLLAVRESNRPADQAHPYGHGRIETLASVLVGGLLAAVAFTLALYAARGLIDAPSLVAPEPLALLFAAVAVLTKEALFRYTRRMAARLRSTLLVANAWHHRSDVASSLVVLAGVIGALVGFPWLDSVAALIVAAMIAVIAGRLVYRGLAELIDRGLDPERLARIDAAIRGVDGVQDLHLLRTRRMGGSALVDVHIRLASRISVSEAHHVSERVRARLLEADDDVADVTVHVDPELDDARERLSLGLPSRSELLAELAICWQGLAPAERIQRIDLHYLDGRVHVELFLAPGTGGDGRGAAWQAARLLAATRRHPKVGDVQVWLSPGEAEGRRPSGAREGDGGSGRRSGAGDPVT